MDETIPKSIKKKWNLVGQIKIKIDLTADRANNLNVKSIPKSMKIDNKSAEILKL